MSRKRPRVPGTPKRRRPSWKVMLIGTGGCNEPGCTHDHSLDDPGDAFAYTVGLHQGHRLPELQISARPDDDGDRYLDWHQMGEVMNRLADGVAARTYRPGSTVVVEDVQGFGDVVCSLGEPVPRDELEAFCADEAAEAIQISWNMTRPHVELACIVIGARSGAPIDAVQWHPEKVHPVDSGFVVFHDWTPDDPKDLAEDISSSCMHCLIEKHPEVGVGLDLAREHGAAHFDGERWVAGEAA